MRAFTRLWLAPAAACWIAGPAPAARQLPDPRIEDLIIETAALGQQVSVQAQINGSGHAAFRGTLELTLGERTVRLPVALERGPAGAVGTVRVNQMVPLRGAKPWTPSHPVLYQMGAALMHAETVRDRRTIRFGFRTVTLADGRLSLNGNPTRVRAIELRPDWSMTLTATARQRAATRTLERIHAAGITLLLTDHGALDDASLDWCDRHGLMIIEGPRMSSTDVDGANQAVVAMIRAHRNHAAVVGWRIPGRPEPEPDDERDRLLAAARALDAGRPAVCRLPWPGLEPDERDADAADLNALGLEKDFGTVTAFNESLALVRAERRRREAGMMRLDPDLPGFILPASAEPSAGRLLVMRPAPILLLEHAPLCVTLFVTEPDHLPRGARLEWRLGAPGDDPAYPMPWRAGPPLTGGSALLTAPPPVVRGRWTLEARVMAGKTELASAMETLHVFDTLDGSQLSFALLGSASPLRDAYASWIIPLEDATRWIWVHPSQIEAPVMADAVARVRAGGTAILLEPDDADLLWLARALPQARPLQLAPSATVTGARIHFLRSGRMALGLPAIGRGQPERLLLGPLYDDVVPERPLAGTMPDAPAGSFMASLARDADSRPAAGTTDVAELPLGQGHLFVCTLRLVDHVQDAVARALLFRLLNWDPLPPGSGTGSDRRPVAPRH